MQIDASLLGALRCFETAARQLSFTKAARVLHLTQSAVSQQIRHLEDRLGYALFVRQPRGLALTAKGEALFETVAKAFAEITRSLQRLGAADALLQINCPPSFALQWLMPRLTEFQRQRPDIRVRLKADFELLDARAMAAQAIDVAIRYDPLHYERMHAQALLDEYLVPVATPEYLARHPRAARGESLEGVTLLHDGAPWAGAPEFIEWRTWLEAKRPGWLEQLGGQQFNLASLALGAALNHQGIALGRTALIHDELASGRLVSVLGARVRAPARYVLLSCLPDDERVAAFSTWLEAECASFDAARAQGFEAQPQATPR